MEFLAYHGIVILGNGNRGILHLYDLAELLQNVFSNFYRFTELGGCFQPSLSENQTAVLFGILKEKKTGRKNSHGSTYT